MTNQPHRSELTDLADNCAPLRTKSGQNERLRVAAYTEPQIQAFCRSHQIPRPNVVRIRQPEDLHGWKPGLLLLLPFWWRGTNDYAVTCARDRGWTIAEVTEEEVLNGPTPPAERPTPTVKAPSPGCPVSGMRPAERPTPETDAHILETINDGLMGDYLSRLNRLIPHARRLERERDEWRNEAERWKQNAGNAVNEAKQSFESLEKLSIAIGANDGFTRDDDEAIVRNSIRIFEQLKGELAEARERRDRLADALREIEKKGHTGSSVGPAIAREALKEITNVAMDLPGDPNGPKTNSDVAAG